MGWRVRSQRHCAGNRKGQHAAPHDPRPHQECAHRPRRLCSPRGGHRTQGRYVLCRDLAGKGRARHQRRFPAFGCTGTRLAHRLPDFRRGPGAEEFQAGRQSLRARQQRRTPQVSGRPQRRRSGQVQDVSGPTLSNRGGREVRGECSGREAQAYWERPLRPMCSEVFLARLILSVMVFTLLGAPGAPAQSRSGPTHRPAKAPVASVIALHESSRASIASEMGGAFMSGSRCDADGNLYIRKYATDRPMLSPVVKIDADGKRTALFDPVSFSQLKLNRADAFAPAADGGLYQMASTDGAKPRVYVLHFSPDGSSSSPILLESEIEPYQFAPFPGGNLLVSGFQ